MAWYGIEGHDRLVQQLERQLAGGRLRGSYMFVGPPGIGKARFARQLAQCLLCPHSPTDRLEACGQCPACQQVAALTHPDLEIVCRPPDKALVPVELLIGDREHRMREGLCHHLAMRPSQGPYRIGILDDADLLTVEAANCLLKTLEEPPPRSLVLLIASNELRQLPTICSRCQIVRFRPLPNELAGKVLVELGLCTDRHIAADLARLSHGSLQMACELAEAAAEDFAGQLWGMLAGRPIDWPELACHIQAIVEAAGKEAPARRQRLRQLIWLVAEFARQLMLHLATGQVPAVVRLGEPVCRAAAHWPGTEERAAEWLERSYEALRQVELFAHPLTLIEAWVEDLRRIDRGAMARPIA